eukprot:364697-Chlamydomonas_euryale.AAC.6
MSLAFPTRPADKDGPPEVFQFLNRLADVRKRRVRSLLAWSLAVGRGVPTLCKFLDCGHIHNAVRQKRGEAGHELQQEHAVNVHAVPGKLRCALARDVRLDELEHGRLCLRHAHLAFLYAQWYAGPYRKAQGHTTRRVSLASALLPV